MELAPEYMTLEFREMGKVETNLRRLVRRTRKEVCEKEAKRRKYFKDVGVSIRSNSVETLS